MAKPVRYYLNLTDEQGILIDRVMLVLCTRHHDKSKRSQPLLTIDDALSHIERVGYDYPVEV